MKLKKCENNHYTLKETCPKCKKETKSAHYKYIKVRTESSEHLKVD